MENTKTFNSENESIVRYVQRKINQNVDNYNNLIDYEEVQHMLATKSKKDIVKELLKHLSRAPLWVSENCEEFLNYLRSNSFLATWTNTLEEYSKKLKDRTLTKEEYEKIMKEIEEYGSILPTSSIRLFSYGWWWWDVILSETTNKMYCVESDEDRSTFLQDYKWKQYYCSRSWASGEGYFIAGKKSIIYLPTSRIDVADPNEYSRDRQKMNWVTIRARANRWVVDKNCPVTIFPEDGIHDYVFVDPNNVLEIINIIKSGGKLPEHFKTYTTHICDYFDEYGEEQSLDITYASDKPWPKKNIVSIIDRTGNIKNEQMKLQPTWSEFSRVMGIYKSGDNFVEKWYLWLATKLYGKQNPITDRLQDLFDYEVGPWWKLQKEFYDEVKDLKSIRWWKLLSDTAAYKLDKSTWKYIVMVDYKFSNLSLGEDSESLFQYFPNNSVGGTNEECFIKNDIGYAMISHNWSVVLVAKDIEEDSIQKVANFLGTQTKEEVQDIYERNLREAFSQTLQKARSSGMYIEWRESYKDLLYTCFGNKVYLWYIVKNTDLNLKFSSLYHSVQDYEKVITRDEREKYDKDYWNSYMREKAYDKSIKDYVNFYRWDTEKQIREVRNYLQNNKDKKFFIEDSLEVGNCLPGTQWFMEKFQLKEWVTWEELLEHPKFERMLQEGRFRSVILNKVSIFID